MDINARLAVAFGDKHQNQESSNSLNSVETEELSSLTKQFIGLLSKPSQMKDGHTFRTNEQEGLPPFHFRLKWNICKISKEKTLVIESSPNPNFVPKLVSQGKLLSVLKGLIRSWRKSEINKEVDAIQAQRQNEVTPDEKEDIAIDKTSEIVEKVSRSGSTSPQKANTIRLSPTKVDKKAFQIQNVIDKIDPGFIPPRALIRSFDWSKLYSQKFFGVLSGLNFELQQLGCDPEDLYVLSKLASPDKNSYVSIPKEYPYSPAFIAKELFVFIVAWCHEYLVTGSLLRRSKKKTLLLDDDFAHHSRVVLTYYLLSEHFKERDDDVEESKMKNFSLADAIGELFTIGVLGNSDTARFIGALWKDDSTSYVRRVIQELSTYVPLKDRFIVIDNCSSILSEAERKYRVISMLENQIEEMSD